MLSIIPTLIIAIPKAMATPNNLPTACIGESHSAGKTPSTPMTLPYRKPNTIELHDAHFITYTRERLSILFLPRYAAPSHKSTPCPASPNMNPKKSMNVSATNGDGSTSP